MSTSTPIRRYCLLVAFATSFAASRSPAAATGATVRPDLAGTVARSDGAPLQGARVVLYTAAVKTGTSPLCPSCYADCAKHADSGADGAFRITSLDPQLRFRVLVVADGYKPLFVEKVDPAAGPLAAKLEPKPTDLDPARVVKGRVVDANGQPVVGATVETRGAKTPEKRWWGVVEDADAVAVSNARGEFAIVCKEPGWSLDVGVSARGFADRRIDLLAAGAIGHEIVLTEGATVTGRLVLPGGKPLANVQVGLVAANRTPDQMAGPYTIGTDDAGRFTFSNVVPNKEYFVYGAMTALAARGAVPAKRLTVSDDGTAADAGELAVGPAHRVSGRVVLSDGKPVPAGTQVMISRHEAWDSQRAPADADGRFEFRGVPDEMVSLSVIVRGYHLSPDNKSLDRLNWTFLEGRVDADVTGLVIQLDPGPVQRPTGDDRLGGQSYEDFKRIKKSRIEGAPRRAGTQPGLE